MVARALAAVTNAHAISLYYCTPSGGVTPDGDSRSFFIPFLLVRWSTQGYLIGLLAAWLLAGCAGYSATILYIANASEAAVLAASFTPHWPAGHHLAASYTQLRLALAGAAAGLGGVGGTLAWAGRGHGASRLWRRAWWQAGRYGDAQAWHALSPRQRHLALALLALLTGIRLVVSRLLIAYDDSFSYALFVSKSLLTVNAWYPFPNNHVFSNTLSWVFYQVHPSYWWSMRVPVLLLSTAGTIGWFLGLLRHSNFRVTILAVTLFSFLGASLYHTTEGRGYALILVFSCLGFFSTLRLASTTRGWAGLAIAGVLGLYTVPTFLYFLVAAYSWLGVGWLRQRAYRYLLNLGGVGLITLLGAAMLYAPLLLVSGPAALFQNEYVRPLAASAFWRALPAYLGETEGILIGELPKGILAAWHLGVLATLVVLAGFLVLLRAARRGQLAHSLAATVLRLGVPALWFAAVPYALMLAQRVLAPSRTLLFKSVFLFLLVALEADWLLQGPGTKSRWLRPTLLLAVGLWVGMQVVQLYRANELLAPRLHTNRPALRRLLTQTPEPVFMP